MQISVDYGKYRWGLCQTAIGSARLSSARVGERVDVSSKHILHHAPVTLHVGEELLPYWLF